MPKQGDSSNPADGESGRRAERSLPTDNPHGRPPHPDEVKLHRSLRRASKAVEAAKYDVKTTEQSAVAAFMRYREEQDRSGGSDTIYEQITLRNAKIQAKRE